MPLAATRSPAGPPLCTCYRRMNAQEVLSKDVADAESSHAEKSTLADAKPRIVNLTTDPNSDV